MMDILTQASESYMATFHAYTTQFLAWGQWVFMSLIIINLVLMCVWHAFDYQSFSDGMSSFIKKFFVITFFYTVMIHPERLMQLLETAQFMGQSLTHVPIDPSSIISQGIALGNKVIFPVQQSSLLMAGFTLIMLSVVYLIVLFVFISIALDLAVTLIITTALISIATFFLGFAALGATTQIARQTLDTILANCVKLLAIYLVVAAGSQTIRTIAASIPTTFEQLKSSGFDVYAWVVAASVLFWLIAKNLPVQVARIVSGAVHENRGTDVAGLAGAAAIRQAETRLLGSKGKNNASQGIPVAGISGHPAGAQFEGGIKSASNSAMSSSFAQSSGGSLSDHFKHIAGKRADGQSSPSLMGRPAHTPEVGGGPTGHAPNHGATNTASPNESYPSMNVSKPHNESSPPHRPF